VRSERCCHDAALETARLQRSRSAVAGAGAEYSLTQATEGSARMSLIVFLILLALFGLVTGTLARLLLPGPDPMGIGMTIAVGVLGSFAAGLFSWYVLHRHGAGLLLSVVFSMLLLFVLRRSGGRRRT
jgi:uncharacterized membrane protein YeaQ/YmgE (transglycosylase-associated protein family)